MNGATISTHILDLASGAPAAGVDVALLRDGHRVAAGRTDGEGRIAQLAAGQLEPGVYRLVFGVGPYFGDREHLYRELSLELELGENRHYHLPLLLSPYSCTTYRGS